MNKNETSQTSGMPGEWQAEGKKKTKIVCLGDSITEGFGLGAEENYPVLLGRRLGGEYEIMNAGVTAHCVTDETAPDGRTIGLPYMRTEKYAAGIAAQGDIYVLLLGTNDAQDGLFDDGSAVDPYFNVFGQREHFIRHYERILSDVRRANPAARIYVCRPVPILNCIWPKHQQKYLDVILDKLDEIGRRNPDVRMLDLFSAFRSKGDAWLKSVYQTDGLHPGPEGAAFLAELVADRLAEDARG